MNLSTHKRSEVDIRVAQELKNNQDFIYQTNQSLQNLSTAISALSLNQEKLIAKQNNLIKSLEIEIHSIQDNVNSTLNSYKGVISKHEMEIFSFLQRCNKKFEYLEESCVEQEAFTFCLDTLEERMEDICKDLREVKEFFESSLSLLKGQIQGHVDSIRQDLTPEPVKGDPIKEAIVKEFKPIYIDFDGLKKEIELLKKAVHYGEKKFENLYTLIDRLKEES